jgi:N-acetylglucosaminyldiphosphoundecaprenol N-acetyl-beta-D-mannosaminyltransferase
MDSCILGTRIDPTSYASAAVQILGWAQNHESRYICIANVHMVMEAYDNPDFMNKVNRASLITPDGMPLVWVLHHMGYPNQPRVYGPDLMLKVLEQAVVEKIPVGFLGGKPEVLKELLVRLQEQFPNLDVRYSFSPPFRPILPEEDSRMTAEINNSSARILFIGLGCPRQEIWMAEHAGKIQSVMMGVGAAFDFHAGAVRQAPHWMQNIGLEWLFRFIQEPRRLLRRYLYHNPRFIVLVLAQLIGLSKKINT